MMYKSKIVFPNLVFYLFYYRKWVYKKKFTLWLWCMKWNKSFQLVPLYVVFITVLIGIRFKSYFFLPIPLWYDWGMYRDFMLASFNFLPHIHLGSFAPWIQQTYEPWLWLLTNIPLLFWYSVDWLLLWWLGFLSVVTWIFIYLALKKYGKYTAYLWMLLFRISLIQYQTFWRWYLKQIIGIILMLSIFTLFERKKYRIQVPLLILLFAINRPGGIFFLLVFALWQLVSWLRTTTVDKKSLWMILWSGLLALGIYIPVFREQILVMFSPLFSSIFIEGTSGTFFSLKEFIFYDIFFILFSLRWVYRKIIKKDRDWMLIWWVVWCVWVFLGLFFYSRVSIYWDIFIILLAAYGLKDIYQNKKLLFYWLFGGFLVLQSSRYLYYVGTMSFPLIDQSEFINIHHMDTLVPDKAIIMVTNKKYSAFVQWWTHQDIIAPWLFDLDRRDQSRWDARHQWDGTTKCIMMQDYSDVKRPIYLRIGKNQPVENFEGQRCFESIENWWSYLILKWIP